jgi:peptidoglycan-N-acetylglucosamine deacetylase
MRNIMFLCVGVSVAYFLSPNTGTLIFILCGVLTIFLFLLFRGVFDIQFNYFLSSQSRINGAEVLLTFDDGPEPQRTLSLINVLKKHDIGAVFFMIGKKMEAHPTIVEEVKTSGFLIGNHSYTHGNNFPIKSSEEIKNELQKTEAIIGNKYSNQLFRPPMGITNPNVARGIKKANLKSVGWSIRSFDTIEADNDKMFQKVFKRLKPGAILLFHDNGLIDLEKFDQFLTEAKQKGVIFAKNDQIKTMLNA